MSTETSGVKEKELTGMTKRDIRQFIINLDEEDPDEYKAQARVLYEAGVTGAALKADYEDGKEAFIKAMKDDYKIMGTAFAKTLYQKLKEKLQRGEKRKSTPGSERGSDTKGDFLFST